MMFKKEGFLANKEEMLMTSAMMRFARHAKNVEIGAKKKKATTTTSEWRTKARPKVVSPRRAKKRQRKKTTSGLSSGRTWTRMLTRGASVTLTHCSVCV
jgi:hypothetical protein